MPLNLSVSSLRAIRVPRYSPKHKPEVMIEHPDILDDWRRRLRAQIAWALAAKLLALTLLWFFFFRG